MQLTRRMRYTLEGVYLQDEGEEQLPRRLDAEVSGDVMRRDVMGRDLDAVTGEDWWRGGSLRWWPPDGQEVFVG